MYVPGKSLFLCCPMGTVRAGELGFFATFVSLVSDEPCYVGVHVAAGHARIDPR